MSTYIIGDVQGCLKSLEALLTQINFNPQNDKVIFVGDLVNRGPQSLETLRFIKDLGSAAESVLGNHDLFLLAAAYGREDLVKPKDTIQSILTAPDKIDLIEWLRHRPLIIPLTAQDLVVHAGIPPQWDRQQALQEAHYVEQVLRSSRIGEFVSEKMLGNKPLKWKPTLTSWKRLRYAVNAFVRMRFVTAEGKLDFKAKVLNAPHSGYHPWFAFEARKTADQKIYFGHWSALRGDTLGISRVYALDTGCLWGGQLTALEFETGVRHQLDCPVYQAIDGES